MADITPGYTFSVGETNVNDVKLNTAAAGTINTTFHTGKSSAGSNPNTATFEAMVFDTGTSTFKKGSLSSLFFDHTGLLSGRSAKTVPVAADAALIADSAASGAYKQITLANLLFGAAAHGAPVAGDKLAIYDSVGTAIKTITLQNLVAIPSLVGTVDGSEAWSVITGAGALRQLTFARIGTNAADISAIAGTSEQMMIISGGVLYKVMFGDMLRKQTAYTNPAVDDVFLSSNTSGVTRKITTQNLKVRMQKGYALVRDEKAQNTQGGTLTSGSWQVRTLQTISVDNLGISVGSNLVNLPAGTFRFRARAPFYKVGACQVRLWNNTDSAVLAIGQPMNTANSANTAVVISEVTGRFTIAGAKDIRIEYQIGASVSTSDGGVAGNFTTEVYSTLEFWQED